MRKITGWICGVFVLALLCMIGAAAAQDETPTVTDETVIVDDIAPYDGPIGPGSPLYGLKLAFEDLDQSFTANESQRFNKQMNSSRMRLAEARRELQRNNSDAADIALDHYGQRMNMTRLHLQNIGDANTTGLLHAQEMVAKHQLVLANLLSTHPNSTGLMRAYNNSLELEEKFQERTRVRFERMMDKNNATIGKAVRVQIREQQHTRNTDQNETLQVQETRQARQGAGMGMDDDKGKNRVTATPTTTQQQDNQTTPTLAPSGRNDDSQRGNSGAGSGTSHGGGNGNGGNAPGNAGNGKDH